MKLHYIPAWTAQRLEGDPIPIGFRPCYVVHDVNNTDLGTSTREQIIQYSNLKGVNNQRPWKYYRKMFRNITYDATATSAVSVSNRGYLRTSAPLATQCIVTFFSIHMVTSLQQEQ